MRHPRSTAIAIVFLALTAGLPRATVDAQSPAPGLVAVGDSIEFGLGDDVPGDGIGYVENFGTFLSVALAQTVQVHNFSIPAADTRDIFLSQLRPALSAARSHRPIVVVWGGGGNDLARVALSRQAVVCDRLASCLGRFNGLMNELEAAINQTVRALRQAVGPDGRIMMRTQYNALARSGCALPGQVAIGNAVLEGVPGTVLEQGLNDRIRSVAGKYGAQVVDLFVPFALNADAFVAEDCRHPSGAGYAMIEDLFTAVFALRS